MVCTICETAIDTKTASVSMCRLGRSLWAELEGYYAHPTTPPALQNKTKALREFRAHTGHGYTKVDKS